jgi:hypothetical protein
MKMEIQEKPKLKIIESDKEYHEAGNCPKLMDFSSLIIIIGDRPILDICAFQAHENRLIIILL